MNRIARLLISTVLFLAPGFVRAEGEQLHALERLPSILNQADPTIETTHSESLATPVNLRELTSRLTRVEEENRWLRDQVLQTIDVSTSEIEQTNYCKTCGKTSCKCDWASQLSSTCKEKLSWNKGPLQVAPFGYVAGDMIASERAYTLLGGPLFLLPAVPANVPDSRFNFSGQQTTLGFNLSGPQFGTFQGGGVIAFNFFGDRPIQNNPGVFFILGYAQLQNDRWRIWAGQDADSIGRQNTNSPAWTTHKQSGNFGQIRPGFRAERFFALSDKLSTSFYVGLTQQVVLDFIANPLVAGTDNGWPNVEMRWEVGWGEQGDTGRPVMLALGGLIGETRAVDFAGLPEPTVSTTWAVIPECRIQIGRWGFQGEAFVGDALGTYNAAIGQSLNLSTDEAIYTAGGFGEFFCNLSPKWTVSVGYGIDNPREADLDADQRLRNETYWVNAIWRLSEQVETRGEVARQRTDYVAPSTDSKAMQYLVSLRYYF